MYSTLLLVLYGSVCILTWTCVFSLTQQEQALALSQGGWLSPGGRGGGGGEIVGVGGGGGSEAKAVDIIQMLTKARTEYDKVG